MSSGIIVGNMLCSTPERSCFVGKTFDLSALRVWKNINCTSLENLLPRKKEKIHTQIGPIQRNAYKLFYM